MQSCRNTIYLLVVLAVLGIAMVHCEPEPTRRVEVTNWDDLRRYLDHLTDLYSINGKPRYGKRGETPSAVSPMGRNWDAMKTILDVSPGQQRQPSRFGQGRLAGHQFLRELESTSDGKQHASRPYHVLDMVEKYYDAVQ
ncbi:neuropeptide F [Augochlora pura]